MPDNRLWLPELKLGIGIWQGKYKGIERQWLRWYEEADNWVPTPDERVVQANEQAAQANERAAQAEAELARLKALLQFQGIDDASR